MGCHTWCFKEIPCPKKYKNVYSKIEKKINKLIQSWTKFLNGTYDKSLYCKSTVEEYKSIAPDQLKICKDKLELLKKNKTKSDEYLLDLFFNDLQGFDLIYRINRKYYDCENTPHDIFRKYGYPEIRLWSLDEAYNYYINVNNGCYGYDSDYNSYLAGTNSEVDHLTYIKLK